MSKFPKTLFVKTEKDGETTYFVSHETLLTLADIGEKERVGVYKLIGTQEVEGVVQTRPMRKA